MIGWLTLYLTLSTGRAFNYPAGAFTFATQPGIEASCGPVTVNLSLAYDRSGYFERDIQVSVEREINKRLTVTMSASRFDYPGYERDLTWSVDAKWRLK